MRSAKILACRSARRSRGPASLGRLICFASDRQVIRLAVKLLVPEVVTPELLYSRLIKPSQMTASGLCGVAVTAMILLANLRTALAAFTLAEVRPEIEIS